MPYKFAQNRQNYEMYAAGGVFYAIPGRVAFPVRLSDEIFRRCMALWDSDRRCTLYDPCCGGAYHLATLAYFNWDRIERIVASDLDTDVLPLAERNLSLLEIAGLEKRIEELSVMARQFGKMSHGEALKYARQLKQRLRELTDDHRIKTRVFRADATDPDSVRAGLAGAKIDIVITDLPYGQHSIWYFTSLALLLALNPVHQMLESLLPVLSPDAVVAVAAAKNTSIKHDHYHQVGKLKLGKRMVVFLKQTPYLQGE
jgi:hypothetical protein